MKKIPDAPLATDTQPDAIADPVRETTAIFSALPPRAIDVHTPIDLRAGLRVVDVETGDEIAKVIAADVDAKTVTRFAVEDGNLVRKDDRFVMIDEIREIRIEWAEEAAE